MCGIAGWVDFDRPVDVEQAMLRAMTATMALRGPDAEGVWTGRHVGFGHRRLAVIDPVGGAQPMTVEDDGRTVAALTYSGEVYNYRELRSELQTLGHTFRTASDSEVALHAYLEWGVDFVQRLNGMFAFGIWDARTEQLLLVRDRMGIKPLFWYPTPSGVLFGSEPKAILAHPLADPVVDADGLRELLSMVKTPGATLYRGLYEVQPGQLIVVDRSGAKPRHWWKLEPREHTDDLDTTVRTVRDLLDDIVRRQLIADVPLCSLLSGGLDSSAITALAAGFLRQDGAGPVSSFAVDFVGQTENFVADDLRGTPDAPYVKDVAQHIGARHVDIMLDSTELMDPLARLEVMAAGDAPNRMGDMFTSLYLLFRAVRERSTVALSGESADEVFGGYRWFHDPAAVDADDFPWMAAVGHGAEELLTPDLAAQLDLPGYRRDSYRSALAQVEHLPGEDAKEHRMREVSHLHLTRFVQVLLDRKDRMSMAHGLEVRVPFCDHRLVEYVYNTPWSMKTFDGREKSLLRAATADVLPQSVVQRVKSPYPSTQDPAYRQALAHRLKALLADPDSAVTDVLDVRKLEELSGAEIGTDGFDAQRGAAELALGLDEWLRRTPVRVAV